MEWTLLVIGFGGIVGWLFVKRFLWIAPPEACQLINQGAKVIDVREHAEYQSEHLPQAINIPLGKLAEQIGKQFPDKETILLLHCLSGGRSEIAKRNLRQMGYLKAYNLGSYGRAQKIMSRCI